MVSIEATIIGYLNNKLNIEAYAEEPEKAPKQYIVVQNQGTSRSNWLCSSLIAVQVYGTSMLDSINLTQQVQAVMDDIIEEEAITKIEQNSAYPFNDPETHRYRYQVVYDIYHYYD
jgi:hypothetical protein